MKEKNKKILTKAGWLLFYLYIILLSYFLFFSEYYGRANVGEDYRYNLEFLKEIKRFIQYREQLGFKSFAINIIGNVLAFVPFGFLLPQLKKIYRNLFIITFLTIIVSLSAELIQLVFKVGAFDVDDIMLNTLGGIIGYVLYVLWDAFLSRRRNNKKKGRK